MNRARYSRANGRTVVQTRTGVQIGLLHGLPVSHGAPAPAEVATDIDEQSHGRRLVPLAHSRQATWTPAFLPVLTVLLGLLAFAVLARCS